MEEDGMTEMERWEVHFRSWVFGLVIVHYWQSPKLGRNLQIVLGYAIAKHTVPVVVKSLKGTSLFLLVVESLGGKESSEIKIAVRALTVPLLVEVLILLAQ